MIDGKHGANDRTLCGRVEITSRGVPEWDWGPYFPGGTVQSKVVDAKLAEEMEFWGQIGHHGSDFLAEEFLKLHPEYDWMRPLLQGHEVRALDQVQGPKPAVPPGPESWAIRR